MKDDEVLVREVYPAEVLLPDGSLLVRCRTFVTNYRMLAYTSDKASRTVKLAAEIELAEPGSVPHGSGTLQGRLEVRGPEGTAWINRGRGCTCRTPELTALAAPVPRTRRR